MSRQNPGIRNPLCRNPGAMDLLNAVTARMIARPEAEQREACAPDSLRRKNKNPTAAPATKVGRWKSGSSSTKNSGSAGTKCHTAGGSIAQIHIGPASAINSASRRVRSFAAIHGNRR